MDFTGGFSTTIFARQFRHCLFKDKKNSEGEVTISYSTNFRVLSWPMTKALTEGMRLLPKNLAIHGAIHQYNQVLTIYQKITSKAGESTINLYSAYSNKTSWAAPGELPRNGAVPSDFDLIIGRFLKRLVLFFFAYLLKPSLCPDSIITNRYSFEKNLPLHLLPENLLPSAEILPVRNNQTHPELWQTYDCQTQLVYALLTTSSLLSVVQQLPPSHSGAHHECLD